MANCKELHVIGSQAYKDCLEKNKEKDEEVVEIVEEDVVVDEPKSSNALSYSNYDENTDSFILQENLSSVEVSAIDSNAKIFGKDVFTYDLSLMNTKNLFDKIDTQDPEKDISRCHGILKEEIQEIEDEKDQSWTHFIKKDWANDDSVNIIDDHICAITYRNTFRKVMSEWRNVTIMKSLDNVWKEIEKLYKERKYDDNWQTGPDLDKSQPFSWFAQDIGKSAFDILEEKQYILDNNFEIKPNSVLVLELKK